MVKTWFTRGDAQMTAAGKVETAFEKVTEFIIKKKKNVEMHLLAIYINYALAKPTSGENAQLMCRLESDEVPELNGFEFLVGAPHGDAVATHNAEILTKTHVELIDVPSVKGGEKILLKATSGTTITEGWDVTASLQFSDSPPSPDFKEELRSQVARPATRGKLAFSRAGITSAANFTTGIPVDGKAQTLTGLLSHVHQNAPTEADPLTGFTTFESGTMDDFNPQELPFCIGASSILGTRVTPQGSINPWYYPTRFDMPQENFTISISQNPSTTLGAAADGYAGAKWVNKVIA